MNLSKIIICLAALASSCYAVAQIGPYMGDLIGRKFECVVNPSTGEIRYYQFTDEDGDGWASGEQGGFMRVSDPDVPGGLVPYYDMFEAFEIEQSDQCGNCMVLKFEYSIKYFIVDHEVGNFWIQETDENFKALSPETIYYPVKKEGPVEVYATSYSIDRLIEWPEENPNDGGWIVPDKTGFSFDGIEVSSTLDADDKFNYEMANAFDDNPNTTWFSNPENNDSYPSGEYITFTGKIYSESIWILNGMQYSGEDFENNSRAKTIELYINEELIATVELLDVMGEQQITIPGIDQYQQDGPVTIQFVILEVYPGSEYPECGITEIFTKKLD